VMMDNVALPLRQNSRSLGTIALSVTLRNLRKYHPTYRFFEAREPVRGGSSLTKLVIVTRVDLGSR